VPKPWKDIAAFYRGLVDRGPSKFIMMMPLQRPRLSNWVPCEVEKMLQVAGPALHGNNWREQAPELFRNRWGARHRETPQAAEERSRRRRRRYLTSRHNWRLFNWTCRAIKAT